jgi:transcriptional regulator with XRE-family HTH domain
MAGNKRKIKRDPVEQELLDKIGARLRFLRKERGFNNYEQFANQYNLNRSQIGQYEKGQNMNLTTLAPILRALGVSWKEFFSEGFDDDKA